MNTQNSQHTAIVQLCSIDRIDACFQALCQQWKDKGANHSCWHLRFHWPARKIAIREQLLAGTYRFSPCRAVKINDHSIGLWNAEDTLVIKLLSHYLSALMLPKLSPRCMHIKGNGGLKQAVMQAKNHSPEYAFVLKSDVKSYYATMKHSVIIKQCRRFVDCPIVLDLLWQFLTHLDDVDGELFLCTQGIGKGSSLSPLLAALYLDDLDKTLGAYADKVGGSINQRLRR